MAVDAKLPLALFLSSLLIHAPLAEIVCEDLSVDVCAFSIASSGKRCLLETAETENRELEYQCRTSEVTVQRMAGYIESDRCVEACGLYRSSVGISSDALLEPEFTAKLCSRSCFLNCPNVVDLYFNLAAGEGVLLSDLCERQRSNPLRARAEPMSSGVAAGPVSELQISPCGGSGVAAGPVSELQISPASAPSL